MRSWLRGLTITLVLVTAIAASFFVGDGSGLQATSKEAGAPAVITEDASIPDEVREQFGIFWEAWDVVNQEFFNQSALDAERMTYGAISGMLGALGDPHTAFFSPQQTRLSEEDIWGSFEGIGVVVEIRNGILTVVAPLPDAPGQKAGVRPGDTIYLVDGVSTESLSLSEAVSRIRGPKGTTVHLTIIRAGERSPIELDIVRADIVITTVQTQLLEDGIGYVRLTRFTQMTMRTLTQQLEELLSEQPQALILDLRNNPGGLLDTSVEVASIFLQKEVVLYEQGREGEPKAFKGQRGSLTIELPLVVLINKGTASASEIVAGALKDTGRATLIGEQTYGKGSVQNIRKLGDGSTLHITVAHWFTPNFTDLEGVGISPDITVELTEEDIKEGRDPQLAQAIEFVKSGKAAALSGGS